MWYISFHGGSSGINNILVYHDSGVQHSHPDLLPTGGSNPALQELRGFAIVSDLLYVVNAYKDYSQILVYKLGGNGGYSFKEVFASKDTINSILHPYDLTFDPLRRCYVSSQDTNVVTGLEGTNSPLQVASYLQQQYPPPDEFLAGTIVASSMGALPGVAPPTPPDVLIPQGLEVSFTDTTNTQVANSVRGVLFYNGYLYVADEPANAVKVYDGNTGELYGQIAGDNLRAPVQLLLAATTGVLYISSSGNDSVVSYDLSQGTPSGTVTPATFIEGKVKHISGMGFDADGYFYAAERKAQKIKKFPPDGGGGGKDFITDLPDEPEFIMYVPKSDTQKRPSS
jgi:hypothetical protein